MSHLNEGEPVAAADLGAASGLDRSPDPWTVFCAYIDVYKHHFELWLKGYLVYLAIVGVSAGFVFNEASSANTRYFLLWFLVVISALAVVAWSFGLVWLNRFEVILSALAQAVHVPFFGMMAFRVVVLLGLVGSVVVVAAALYLHASTL